MFWSILITKATPLWVLLWHLHISAKSINVVILTKRTPPPRGFFFFGDFQLYSKKLVLLFRVRPRPVGSAFGNHTKKNTTGGFFQSTCTYQLTFESLQKSAGMCKCRAKRDQQRQCRVKRDQQHMSPVARHLQQRMSLLTPHMWRLTHVGLFWHTVVSFDSTLTFDSCWSPWTTMYYNNVCLFWLHICHFWHIVVSFDSTSTFDS